MLHLFTSNWRGCLRLVERSTFDAAVRYRQTISGDIEGGTVYFIGNGGSAAIASHMAIDWMNKAGFDTRDLNNPAALTCLANDYGYKEVFARQLTNMSKVRSAGGDLEFREVARIS